MSGVSATLRFDANGLVPAVVQEAGTGEVLMVAWMNAEAIERTLATGLTHFWSRSRRALWQKGETSGHRQHVEAVYADCDGDTLLIVAHQDRGRLPHREPYVLLHPGRAAGRGRGEPGGRVRRRTRGSSTRSTA